MALGLVQPNRDIPIATPKATVDIHQTPKHIRKQRTISFSNATGPKSIDIRYISKQSMSFSVFLIVDIDYNENHVFPIFFRMDIVLDTPVLVLPRSSRSSQVFVVHLGKISMTNTQPNDMAIGSERETPQRHFMRRKSNECDLKIFTIDEELLLETSQSTLINNFGGKTNDYYSEEDLRCKSIDTGIDDCDGDDRHIETYILDIRNINAYSLDTRNRKSIRLSALPRAEEFYSCQADAVPVLYDTAIRVNITRCLETPSIDLLVDSVDSKELLQVSRIGFHLWSQLVTMRLFFSNATDSLLSV